MKAMFSLYGCSYIGQLRYCFAWNLAWPCKLTSKYWESPTFSRPHSPILFASVLWMRINKNFFVHAVVCTHACTHTRHFSGHFRAHLFWKKTFEDNWDDWHCSLQRLRSHSAVSVLILAAFWCVRMWWAVGLTSRILVGSFSMIRLLMQGWVQLFYSVHFFLLNECVILLTRTTCWSFVVVINIILMLL